MIWLVMMDLGMTSQGQNVILPNCPFCPTILCPRIIYSEEDSYLLSTFTFITLSLLLLQFYSLLSRLELSWHEHVDWWSRWLLPLTLFFPFFFWSPSCSLAMLFNWVEAIPEVISFPLCNTRMQQKLCSTIFIFISCLKATFMGFLSSFPSRLWPGSKWLCINKITLSCTLRPNPGTFLNACVIGFFYCMIIKYHSVADTERLFCVASACCIIKQPKLSGHRLCRTSSYSRENHCRH